MAGANSFDCQVRGRPGAVTRGGGSDDLNGVARCCFGDSAADVSVRSVATCLDCFSVGFEMYVRLNARKIRARNGFLLNMASMGDLGAIPVAPALSGHTGPYGYTCGAAGRGTGDEEIKNLKKHSLGCCAGFRLQV